MYTPIFHTAAQSRRVPSSWLEHDAITVSENHGFPKLGDRWLIRGPVSCTFPADASLTQRLPATGTETHGWGLLV